MENPLISEDTLLVFVGHSSDADDEARALCTLEHQIQRELDARIEVMAGEHRFSKVKIWEWNSEAKAKVGGQHQVVHPYLQRANIAVFVFRERIGSVTWEELNEYRNQYTNPLIAAFPSKPPSLERMSDIHAVSNWHDLLTRKQSLSSDWVETDSRSVLPLCEYRDIDHLKEIVLDHIKRLLGELLRANTSRPNLGEPKSRSGLATYEELRIAYETTATSRHPCQGVAFDDLDWALVSQFAQNEVQIDKAENTLERLGLLSPLSTPTKTLHTSAVLCFIKHPEKYIPQARSCFVLGDTHAAKITRIDVTGPLSNQVIELERLVTQHMQLVSTFDDGALRRDDYEIPRELIRELISNAVAHRDYGSHGIVRVSLTTDSLEVSNPGAFPGDVPWNWMIRRQFTSNPVDPAIAWYLTKLLALEGIGRGFSLFREYMAKNGKRALVCERAVSPATVTIRVKRPKAKAPSQTVSRGSTETRSGGSLFGSLFRRFRYNREVMICPYCLSNIPIADDAADCPECSLPLPLSYGAYYKKVRPAIVPIIGWVGMGKTTLIATCLYMLSRLSEVWSRFYVSYETETTLKMKGILLQDLRRGELPTRTPSTATHPYVLGLHGMERWEDRMLVLHDLAGEDFSNLEIAQDKARILERARTFLVVYSLSDLGYLGERAMDELLMSYRTTMSPLDNQREKKMMIITLSKADLLYDLPEELAAYLNEDPFVTGNVTHLDGLRSASGMAQYVRNMEEVSLSIERWVAQTTDGIRFLNIAKSMNMELRFSVCSALGDPASDEVNRLVSPARPTRVLDPIFWLFETLQRRQ